MSVLPILLWPDPRLSRPCAPVADGTEVDKLVGDLFETMYAAPGRGLAAPQVGEMLRVFVMDPGWKDGEMTPWVCINPEIRDASAEMMTNDEACLSIPGIATSVKRPHAVTLVYTDLSGARQEARLSGVAALCAQHELDHLDGRVTFDRMEATARAEALARYEALP